ncbi:MAG TPA: hypothetical protein VL334_17320, partial [Anaerolineae bacterium]|nr:hypothetical protein [Anaerolineae bacterium]
LFTAASAILPAPSPSSARHGTPAVRIRFAADGTSATVPSNIGPGEVRPYVLAANQGQTMSVSIRTALIYGGNHPR